MQTSGFLETLAKIKSAGIHSAGNISERKIFGLMVINEVSCAADRERLGVLLLNGDLIAQHGKMLAEDGEQADHRIILALRENPCLKVSLFELMQIHFESPIHQLPGRPRELFGGRLLQQNLSG